jgi:type II secretory pathway component PulM
MKAWFESLRAREKLILIGGGTAAALIFLWFGAMKLHAQTGVLRDSIGAKQRMLVELDRVGAQPAGNAPGAQTPGSTQTLVVMIESSAHDYGIQLTRTRAEASNGVQVSFSNVAFPKLLDWLVKLERERSVTVESASFTSTKQRGVVNGQLVLRRS